MSTVLKKGNKPALLLIGELSHITISSFIVLPVLYIWYRDILYMKGGVLFITSRILVVDLLRKQCPVDKVAGLLVFNSHRYHSISCMLHWKFI